MLKTLIGALALAATLPAAAAAETRVVRYDDLKLTTPAGLERLERRINNAAREVCDASTDYRESLILLADAKKCIAEAKARAMAQVARLDTRAARGG